MDNLTPWRRGTAAKTSGRDVPAEQIPSGIAAIENFVLSQRLKVDEAPSSEDIEFLTQQMRQLSPPFSQLLDSCDAQQERHLIETQDWSSRQKILGLCDAFAFQLQKVGRLDDALRVENIALTIISLEPNDRVDSFWERTQQRNLGDKFQSIGRIHMIGGNLTAALAAFQDADRCYEAD